jgi:hypothetical protein
MKKVLFIIPPYLPFDDYISKGMGVKIPTLAMPYGILSIISYCNQNKEHQFEIYDCNKSIVDCLKNNNEDFEINIILKLNEITNSFKPDIIAISVLCNTSFNHLDYLINTSRFLCPQSLIVLGGGVATNLYKELFEDYPNIDACCYGEGEIPFLKLLKNNKDVDLMFSSSAWITKNSLLKNILHQHDFV